MHLLKEIQNRSIELNHDVLDYDYEDDALDGRITYSPKVSTSLQQH